ncbi:hypothetical protein A2U01_0114147, partial [Trifolium medium]|nr:hypothetical protein [Trifolium medium]
MSALCRLHPETFVLLMRPNAYAVVLHTSSPLS